MSAVPKPLPPYRDLPIDPTRPPRSAWGVFGDDDQVGTINLLTPQRIRDAATLVRKGAVFSLNCSIEPLKLGSICWTPALMPWPRRPSSARTPSGIVRISGQHGHGPLPAAPTVSS